MPRHLLEPQPKPARAHATPEQPVSPDAELATQEPRLPRRERWQASIHDRVPERMRAMSLPAHPTRNRTAAWMTGLALGAVLLLILGLHPSLAAPAGTDSTYADGLGGDSAAGLYADRDVVAGQELSAAEASKRLAQLRASRATRPAATATAAWVNPVPTARLSSCFCERWGTMHWGIDLAAPLGTPIYAAGDGVVLKAGPASGFGNAVYIQHENGDVSIYGHMAIYSVQAGDIVHAGQEIALVGSEGQSTGPHCHFEIHQGGIEGTRIDPIPWLAERGVVIAGS